MAEELQSHQNNLAYLARAVEIYVTLRQHLIRKAAPARADENFADKRIRLGKVERSH